MRIKKGDQVQIIAGKDKGKSGKVTKTIPHAGKIVVDGLNMVKKHVRARREGEKGQRVEIAAPLDASNAMLVCPQCGKPSRVAYKITAKDKTRVCKKCGKEI